VKRKRKPSPSKLRPQPHLLLHPLPIPLRLFFLSCHRWAGRPADVCVCEEESSTAWLHRSSASSSAMLVRSLPRVGPGSFLASPRTIVPEGLLLASPLGAVLEKLLPGLDTVLAPPAGGVRSACSPSQILAVFLTVPSTIF